MEHPAVEGEVNITVILGTARPGNYTSKAAALVADELESRGASVTVVDPADLHLGPPGIESDADGVTALRDAVRSAVGVIMCTPEYHGSFSGMMKVIIENLGYPSGLHHKPVGLLGVADGAIGAIKSLEHLRSVCSHIGALVLPGPVSVARVRRVFSEDGTCNDPAVEKRIRGLAESMTNYIARHVCPALALEEMVRSE